MWVARDKDGDLWMFMSKPIRHKNRAWVTRVKDMPKDYSNHCWETEIDSSLYPELKWEDEPIEVELRSKKILKKNY